MHFSLAYQEFSFVPLAYSCSTRALAFPMLEVSRSANLIEREMHMFITRMGILSLGEVGAQSIFDILKQMRDYGELATEVQRIETLVDKWHTSLPEAARIVAQQAQVHYGRIFSIGWRFQSKQDNQSMNSCDLSKKRLLSSTTRFTTHGWKVSTPCRDLRLDGYRWTLWIGHCWYSSRSLRSWWRQRYAH